MEWTGQVFADRPAVAVQARVQAPAERIWGLVSDIHLMPGLSTELRDVTWLGGVSGPAVGHCFTGRNANSWLGEWHTVSTIVECDEPHRFAWAVGDPDHPAATWRFIVRPDGPATLVEQSVQVGPGRSGLNRLIDATPESEQQLVFVRLRDLETAMTCNLAAIKELAEAAEAPRLDD